MGKALCTFIYIAFSMNQNMCMIQFIYGSFEIFNKKYPQLHT